jgi:hypothetical protein
VIRPPVACLLLLACAREPPAAAEPPPAQPLVARARGSQEVPDFSLEIVVPRARVALGEPVHLLAVLENTSKSERSIRDLLAPEYGFLRVSVRRPGEEAETPCLPMVRREARARQPRAIPPGGKLAAAIAIFASRDGWLLDRPGSFRVSAEFSFEEGKVAAKTIELEVAAPSNDGEREAASLMMRKETVHFLLLGGDDASGDGRKALETIERDHAKSPLAPYAKVALALADGVETLDPKTKERRPARPEAAVARLTPALPEVPDPVFAVRGMETLVRCLRVLGREEEAKKSLQAFRERRAAELKLPGFAEKLDALASEKSESNKLHENGGGP